MKNLFLVVSLLMSTSAFAANINSGRVNAEKGVIELDVSYSGGCQKHDFSLQVGACLESFPVQCIDAKLVENAHGDTCEAFPHEMIEISLEKTGLTDAYYTRAHLTIKGDNNTKVDLQLP